MQRMLGIPALLAWASPALALRLPDSHWNLSAGAHVQNLAGESFDMNQPGDHVLLRVPPDSGAHLLRVSGYFVALAGSPCAIHASMLTIKGIWLGNLTVRVTFMNHSVQMKVSSKSPPYAGPWRSIADWSPMTQGPEVMPETFVIKKDNYHKGLNLYAGPGTLAERPVMKVRQGFHSSLDVTASNLKGFKMPQVGGLLGSSKHNRSLEALSYECESSAEGIRKTVSATVDNIEGSEAFQSTHLRNLRHEKFTIYQPGEFVLLRVPQNSAVPSLIKVKGSFVAGLDAPCVVFLQRATLTGKWFGNKTVHLSSIDGNFGIKVSSTEPAYAGKLRSIKEFFERGRGPEVLPHTVKITTMLDGPSFKFQLGPKKLSDRANILVTQTPFGGLNIGISHMERTEQPIGGMLGMDKHDQSVVTPSENCKGQLPQAVPNATAREQQDPGAGSVLRASWTA